LPNQALGIVFISTFVQSVLENTTICGYTGDVAENYESVNAAAGLAMRGMMAAGA
jgi:hypothetical protein